MTLRAVSELDAAAAAALGLPAEDARLVDAMCVQQQPLETVWSPEHKDQSIELTAPLVAKNVNKHDGYGVYSAGTRCPVPDVGQHYFEVTFLYPRRSKGASIGGAYLVGVAVYNPEATTNVYNKPGHWGLEDDSDVYEDGEGRSVDGHKNANGRLYGSGERVGVLADMDARPRTLRFFREGALLDGVVCSGFPEHVRICASPYNTGVTATLSFPARPE